MRRSNTARVALRRWEAEALLAQLGREPIVSMPGAEALRSKLTKAVERVEAKRVARERAARQGEDGDD